MATAEEGYGARYSKIKTNQFRSLSPNNYQPAKDQSSLKVEPQYEGGEKQLGKIVCEMGNRMDGIEIKIVSITNIVKLLQKYTETKDIQYEKEKQNEEYRKGFNDRGLCYESQQVQSKINQLEETIHKAKVQITAIESLRISFEREKVHKLETSPSSYEIINKAVESPTICTNEIMEEIEGIMEKMEQGLRQEMNQKIDICMSFFKSSVYHIGKGSSPSTVNATMMQEQFHNMTLNMNKVESDCARNKMVMENKIEQIINYVNTIKRKESLQDAGDKESNRSAYKSATRKANFDNEDNKSSRSSISKSRKKSKSQGRKLVADRKSDENHKISSFTKIEDQKKQKEAELKEVLRKKKENQEKLKIKK